MPTPAAATAPGLVQRPKFLWQPAAVLQGHHIETAIICVSGLRLCVALACSAHAGALLDAAVLLAVHTLSLLLEFHPDATIVSPYQLRRSASHGIAQGVLAVPSVLAALTAAAPSGAWQHWLRGSCCAAVSILAAIWWQSATLPPTETSSAPAPVTTTAASVTTPAAAAAAAGGGRQQPAAQVGGSTATRAGRVSYAGKRASQQLQAELSAVLPGCIAAAIIALLVSAASPDKQWQVSAATHSMLPVVSITPPPAAAHAAAAAAVWGSLAAASFSGSLQLLPGCFSLGEAALMAQGLACLVVAAGLTLQHAALFIPPVMCQQLPAGLAATLASRLGGCSAQGHQQALSLQLLPSAVVLILAAALAACLLLRLVWLSWRAAALGRAAAAAGPTAVAWQAAASGADCAPRHGKHSTDAVAANGHSRVSTSTSTARGAAARAVRWLAAGAAAAACLVAAAAIGALLLWLACAAAWTLVEFLPAEPGRLGVLLYWVGLLGLTLPALRLWLARSTIPQIIVRKVYHLLAMGLFVPVFFWDLPLLGLSLAIAFAALVALEVLRCLRLPLLGRAVQEYMQKFVDERDSGVIYITHFTLLLGLAVPMWLCLGMPAISSMVAQQQQHHHHHHHHHDSPQLAAAAAGVSAGSGVLGGAWHGPQAAGGSGGSSSSSSGVVVGGLPSLPLVLMGSSGIIIIGLGDTAASLFGKLYGRLPIHAGSRKTVEGTVAGILSSLGGWVLLLGCGGLLPPLPASLAWWLQLSAATVGAGLLEAATSQLDNILLPLWYLPHVLLLV